MFPSEVATPDFAGRHVVGRDGSCDTVLAGTEISRRHAELSVDGPVLAIRDLGGVNGVFVNGVRQSDAALLTGDVVRCGEWVGVVTDGAGSFGEIAPGWWGGAALREAVEPARRIDPMLPIIVQGETGTGKEGAVAAFHGWSERRGPLVAANCAALPAQLAEAELFGHKKGAFTGADHASAGLFRAAHGGTIFLDEVLELSPGIQAKLLRVLEQREVLGLGETNPVRIDVRVMVATQEPLGGAAADRRFRADLFARLDGLTVVLPPLRNRREDIVPLFKHFLREHAQGVVPDLEPKLVESLCVYDWPLNVRELVLLARRLLGVHGSEGVLRKAHLPERMRTRGPDRSVAPAAGKKRHKRAWRKTDDDAEFEALVVALRGHGGSVARATAAMGITRARAYRLLSARPDRAREDLGR